MLHKIATKLSEALARRGIFSLEDAEVYAYGLELLLSTAISILLVILISVLFSHPLSWLFFLLAFIPLRLTAGGYHANTHLMCIIVFSVGYAALMTLYVTTAGFFSPMLLTAVSAVCFCLDLWLSPVPTPNKPLADKEKRVNRRRSLLIAAVCLLLTALSFFAGRVLLTILTYFCPGAAGRPPFCLSSPSPGKSAAKSPAAPTGSMKKSPTDGALKNVFAVDIVGGEQ